jgi:hypothetical protein
MDEAASPQGARVILALPLAAGLLLALVLGRDVRRLATLPLRGVPLFYVAIALQLVAFPLRFMPWQVGDGTAKVLWLVSYAILCVAAVVNARIAGVPIVAAGMVSNIAAVLANGGHMPALPQALRTAGKTYAVHYNSAASAHPNLSWLVDRWAVPGWLPVGNVYSAGDVVIALGVLCLVLGATRPGSTDRVARLRACAEISAPSTTSILPRPTTRSTPPPCSTSAR